MKPHDPLEDLLRRRTPPSAPAGGPLCGDPELLAAYAENTLDAVARDQFQAHLAGCNACRESVAALVRMAPRPAVSPAPVGASNGWRWIWAAPALAVLALILVMTRPAPVPVAQPPVMTAKNEPPHPPPAVAPARDVPAPKLQRKPLPPSAPAPAVQAEADLKTLDRVEVTAAAPLAAAPVAPPPPPAQVTNAVIGGSFAGNSAAGNSAAGNSAAGQNAIPARGPYANQQNNSGQNALSFVQKSEAPPVPAPQVAAGAAGAARVMAKISLPKPEIPVRIEKGVLSISIDAELTWQAIKTPEAVVSAKFADPLNGEMLSVTRVVYRTKDGGKTWVK